METIKNNKFKKIFSLLLVMVFAFAYTTILSGQIKSTMYLKPANFILPLDNYAYPTEFSLENVSLQNLGFELISLGANIYFIEPDVASMVNVGLDFTIAGFNFINKKEYTPVDPLYDSYYYYDDDYTRMSSVMLSSGLGPVVTINPASKLLIDVFGKMYFTLGNMDYYNRFGNMVTGEGFFTTRYAGGLNIGYDKIAITSEFSYSAPTMKYVENGVVLEDKINAMYFKLGIMIKFSPLSK